MKYQEMDSKVSSMLDKIGNEASNLILDDVALLLTDNKNMNEELENKEKEIESLKNLNSRLQQVNGNLLQQIPLGKEETKKEENEEKRRKFSMRDCFDERGNFKI